MADETNWYEVTDPNSGSVFFFNSANQECSWDLPDGHTSQVNIELTKWWEFFDDTHKRPYYFNTQTGEVLWVLEADITPIRLPAGFLEEEEDSEGEYESEDEQNEEVANVAEEEKEGTNSNLRPGWAEFFDEGTERYYYFNAETNETTWDKEKATFPEINVETTDAQEGNNNNKAEEEEEEEEEVVAEDELMPRDYPDLTKSHVAQLKEKELSPQITTRSHSATSVQLDKPDFVFNTKVEGLKTATTPTRNSMPPGFIQNNNLNNSSSSSTTPTKSKKKRKKRSKTSANVKAPVLDGNIQTDINLFVLEEYAKSYFETHKRGVFRRQVPIPEMLRWSKEIIPTSLLKHNNEKLAKEAVKLFKCIQQYMGDCKAKLSVNDIARSIIEKAIQIPEMRDEIYCQLCKQTCLNPNRKSLLAGWELFVISVLNFPPTRNLEKFLKLYLEEHLKLETEEKDMAQYIVKKLPKICQIGARGRVPSEKEIESAKTAPFKNTAFGVTIEEIMEIQAETGHPDEKLPLIVTTLAKAIFRLKGHIVEGIFRVPGDTEMVNQLRITLDAGKYEVPGDDPNAPASLLKLWMRELEDPIIPTELYDACVKNCNDSEMALKVIDDLPQHNKAVAIYVIHMLQKVSEFSEINKMSVSNLAMVFGPNFLRCPNPDPQVIFENTKYEQTWLASLISNLPKPDDDLWEGHAVE